MFIYFVITSWVFISTDQECYEYVRKSNKSRDITTSQPTEGPSKSIFSSKSTEFIHILSSSQKLKEKNVIDPSESKTKAG